jgi:uncharacterized damage-inducible protein DinB
MFCPQSCQIIGAPRAERGKMNQSSSVLPEPWLRGTLTEVPSVPRAVLHALELAKEDLWKWCFALTDQQLNQRPAEIAPVAFHLRHIARSLDRLLTYAEGRALDKTQFALLDSELDRGAEHEALFAELQAALDRSASRIRQFASAELERPRTVGKKQHPTTIGGLLIHVADHTLRHVGQAITTAKFVAKH